MKTKLLLLGILLAAVTPAHAGEAERMLHMAARAQIVARSVDDAARSPLVSPTLIGEELVAEAVSFNPSQLDDLRGYYVTAQRQGGLSAILVCDANRQVALLEDAGCTQKVEAHRWREDPKGPCAFTLLPVDVCR